MGGADRGQKKALPRLPAMRPSMARRWSAMAQAWRISSACTVASTMGERFYGRSICSSSTARICDRIRCLSARLRCVDSCGGRKPVSTSGRQHWWGMAVPSHRLCRPPSVPSLLPSVPCWVGCGECSDTFQGGRRISPAREIGLGCQHLMTRPLLAGQTLVRLALLPIRPSVRADDAA